MLLVKSSKRSSGFSPESSPLGKTESGHAPRLYTLVTAAPSHELCPSIPCCARHLVGCAGRLVQRFTEDSSATDMYCAMRPACDLQRICVFGLPMVGRSANVLYSSAIPCVFGHTCALQSESITRALPTTSQPSDTSNRPASTGFSAIVTSASE